MPPVSFSSALTGLSLALVGYVVYYNRFQIKYSLNPDTVDMFDRAKRPDGVTNNCDGVVFDEIRTLHNVHDFDTVFKISQKYDAPILAKGFLQNSTYMWDEIYEKQKNHPLEWATMRSNGFGNAFMRGSTKVGKMKGTLASLVDKIDDGLSYFAAFVPFMTRESTNLILPGVDFSQFMFDQSFISHFDRDVVSTPFHAASAATSISVQLTGKKLWLFSDPHDYEDYNIIHMPAAVPVNSTEKDFFNSGKPIPTVLQEPGDMLIFPPHWAHAVITKRGPNVMINFRKFDILRSLRIHFFGSVQMILGSALIRFFQNKDIDKTSNLDKKFKEGFTLTSPNNNALEDQFANSGSSSDNQDSGCRDYFVEWLHRGEEN